LAALLEVRRVHKRYGTTQALTDLDFDVAAGEAVGVVGENGAGKSTFAKILAGAVVPDAGDVFLEGRQLQIRSPRDARLAGIGFIPQELAFVPTLTVAENLLLNNWPTRHGTTSPRAILRHAARAIQRFQIDVPLQAAMAQLKLADQQMVEILKAFIRRSKIILLDEPTAALSAHEASQLFRALESVKSHGVGVVLISHRLDEVLRHCDRIDVFRNSRRVYSAPTVDTPVDEVVFQMLGQAPAMLETGSSAAAAAKHPPALAVSDWQRESHPRLEHVSLDVHEGEVVALFGVRGCGAEVVAEGLAGRHRDITGTLRVGQHETKVFDRPRLARAAGVGYLPPDRKRQGLFTGLSVSQNLGMWALDDVAKRSIINSRREQDLAKGWVNRFNVRYRSLRQPVSELSGGNQQKVLLASRLASKPKVLVLQEPTRGVDIGARLQIHRELRRLAESGLAVLLVTADVEEAVGVADRVLVMRDGVVSRELVGSQKTQSAALRVAAGEES